MPKKSVYFPDDLWPRIQDAAALEDRSVSKWISRTLEAELDARAGKPSEAAQRYWGTFTDLD